MWQKKKKKKKKKQRIRENKEFQRKFPDISEIWVIQY